MTKQVQVFAVFYKGRVKIKSWKTFKEWLIDAVIRVATMSKYSHCELAVTREDGQYTCYSSSPRDGGVRKKVMTLSADKWDFIPAPISHRRIKYFFMPTQGKKYDLLGAIGIPFHTQNSDKWFCSEWVAEALDMSETQISPQRLYKQLTNK